VCIKFKKDVQVHDDKQRIDDCHLRNLISLNKIIVTVVTCLYSQIAQGRKQEQKLLAEK
jgi:hypothetical protein